jgi:hypothetical protein
VSVRIRPSAPALGFLWVSVPSCVVVAQGTLDPLAQVRILARQPVITHSELLFEKKHFIPALQQLLSPSKYDECYVQTVSNRRLHVINIKMA